MALILDVELIRTEGIGSNLNPRTHSELFGFDALSNASVLLPPDFKWSRLIIVGSIANFSKAAQRECTRREIPGAVVLRGLGQRAGASRCLARV